MAKVKSRKFICKIALFLLIDLMTLIDFLLDGVVCGGGRNLSSCQHPYYPLMSIFKFNISLEMIGM